MKKTLREILAGAVMGAVIAGVSVEVFAMEFPAGATVIEDMVYPSNQQVAEAQRYLSENGITIPSEVEHYCTVYGKEYGICPELLEAVCWTESRCVTDAQSGDKKCKGLMQIKPACHADRMRRLGVTNIFSDYGNIHVGADYLAELLQDDEISVALAIYNGASDEAVGRARNGQTTRYAKKVLELSAILERAHYK